jgi:hypothetical protein
VAFEPLRTDEKLDQPIKSKRDFESQMLAGCSVFVVCSFVTFFLSVWPFFVIKDQFLARQLAIAVGLSCIPTLIFGFVAGVRAGASGGFGFLGGAIAVAVFFNLAITQISLGGSIKDFPRPEYPAGMAAWIPLIWVILSGLVTAISTRIGEKRSDARAEKSR